MSRKAKTYIANTDKLIELIARQKKADAIRPSAEEWIAASGVPRRSAFYKLKARKESK